MRASQWAVVLGGIGCILFGFLALFEAEIGFSLGRLVIVGLGMSFVGFKFSYSAEPPYDTVFALYLYGFGAFLCAAAIVRDIYHFIGG